MQVVASKDPISDTLSGLLDTLPSLDLATIVSEVSDSEGFCINLSKE